MSRRLFSSYLVLFSATLLVSGCASPDGLGLGTPTASPVEVPAPTVVASPTATLPVTSGTLSEDALQQALASLPPLTVENMARMRKLASIPSIPFPSSPTGFAMGWSADGRTAAIIGTGGSAPATISALDLTTAQILWSSSIQSRGNWIGLGGDRVAAFHFCAEGECLLVLDRAGGVAISSIPLYQQEPFGLAVSPDAARAAIGYVTSRAPDTGEPASALIALMDLDTGAPLNVLGEALPTALSFSSDGGLLAAATPPGLVTWNLETGAATSLMSEGHLPISLAISQDRIHAATGSSEGDVIVWNLEYGEPDQGLGGSTGEVRAVSFSPDGRMLAVGTAQGQVRVWHLEEAAAFEPLPPLPTVLGVAFILDGKGLGVLTQEMSGSAALSIWSAAP